MSEQQNHNCKICNNKNNLHKELCVDHDHETGKIRGLLCHHCNIALGTFKDNLEILESAIRYLKETKCQLS